MAVSADNSNPGEARQDKTPYISPKLTVYGSVRNLTGNESGTQNGDAGFNMMNAPSDPLLKDNVVRIGEHPAGFGLYLFDYKPEFADFGAGRQFGVMADEVAAIVPEAVERGSHGYLTVDYAKLGITRH